MLPGNMLPVSRQHVSLCISNRRATSNMLKVTCCRVCLVNAALLYKYDVYLDYCAVDSNLYFRFVRTFYLHNPNNKLFVSFFSVVIKHTKRFSRVLFGSKRSDQATTGDLKPLPCDCEVRLTKPKKLSSVTSVRWRNCGMS